METRKKYKILWTVLALAAVVVISAGTSLLVNTMVHKPIVAKAAEKPALVLKNELSLSPDQEKKVEQINQEYKQKSEPVLTAIREKKGALLDELSAENTDTAALNRLASELSLEQSALQQVNIEQFLDLKKVCSPEQTRKLSGIYREL